MTTSRIAFITGGASGLGLATARRFAQDGLTVVVGDLSGAAAEAVARELTGAGHRGLGIDVSDEASVAAAFDAIERDTGPISVLVCFAGILGTRATPGRTALVDLGLAEWEAVHAVNARGTFLCVREYARHRMQRGVAEGRVITVSSLAGQVGGNTAGAAYSSSKGAVLALTKVAARELAPLGITVNALAPGPIDTPMMRAAVPAENVDRGFAALSAVPLGRVGQPEEIAAAAAYLASPLAAFVTGATLDINGGMHMA